MKTLIVERKDGVVTVTMNRPKKKNAIDHTMFCELLEIFNEVTESVDDRVLVLTGAEGNFCAGADLSAGDAPERHGLASMQFYGSVGIALHQVPKPTIAKIRGVAVGAGLNLGLGCDLIAAAEDARLSEIFARRGLSLDVGGSWLLPRLIGLHRAKEFALLADIVSARDAERMGLLNRVVPDAELDEVVDDWAKRLAAGGSHGRRGHGADREFRDRRHTRSPGGVPPEARPRLQGSMSPEADHSSRTEVFSYPRAR